MLKGIHKIHNPLFDKNEHQHNEYTLFRVMAQDLLRSLFLSGK